MKTLLVGINAKYIHTNLAIRLLVANTLYDVDFIEFTIKDEKEAIIDYIINNNYEIVGFSCYIWNIEIIKEILLILKEKSPNITIILGGPEVSYDPDIYINNYQVSYVVLGEGEIAFHKILANLHHDSSEVIPNIVSQDYHGQIHEISDLNSLNSPHYLPNEYKSRITYIETSRGCPFHCAYCLASLEKHVRFFNTDRVKKDILYLQDQGTKTFKFLDRTFNTNPKAAIDIFSFIIANHKPNTSFQFEITGDILHRDIIEYLNSNAPQNLFRFEIGIQSTNITTNIAVDRIQDNQKLFDNIKLIQDGGVIDLHLDLIAGLPYEDLSSFEKTFNDVISLRPKELQLGFLKLLKGTKLRNDASLYGYKFNATAPYEIIENDFLTKADLDDIKTVEQVLEKYYNSMFMPVTINKILDNITSPFSFFLDFGKYYQANFSWYNYNLDDLFTRLFNYLKVIKHPSLDDYLFIMKYDYLNHFKIKPKIWWQRPIKQKRSEMINYIFSHNLSSYSLEDLYRYSLIEKYNNSYLIAIYKGNNTEIKIITINQKKFN